MTVLNKVNFFWAAVVTALTALFGKYWVLFAGFLILEMVDYATGTYYSKFYTHRLSSAIGAKGVAKKVFYWVVIGIAFFVSFCFVDMGEIIGVNLSYVVLFGWYTLATYIINEIRSILENLVKMHINVPKFLVAGLAVASKLTETQTQNKAGGNEN